MKKRIVLASGSKQRQDILKMLGLKFEVLTSSVDEDSNAESIGEYVKELSLTKAQNVAERLKEKAIVIGADTVIFCDGKIYEKPKTKEQAMQNIREFSGKVNTAFTGIAIVDLYQDKTLNFTTSVDIKFRDDISEQEIEWYAQNDEKVLKCCGYSPLGKGAIFIKSVANGDYNTLLGISPSAITEAFAILGYTIFDFEMDNEKQKG